MTKKGLFITVEGIDGCGKTTQLNLISEYLKDKGYEVVFTREPGCRGLGENIRNILLNYDGDVSDRCEAFLFLADRAQNIDVVVNINVAIKVKINNLNNFIMSTPSMYRFNFMICNILYFTL